MPDFNLTVWFGLSTPKGTPGSVIEKLNRALSVALDEPVVVERFADLGYDVPPPHLTAWHRSGNPIDRARIVAGTTPGGGPRSRSSCH